MPLDRQSIEKKDFPTGSHGYDPHAVDAHLRAVADEIAEFKSASRQRAEHLASSAGDQVRSIIEAAEASAAELRRLAEAEAQEIREEAHQEAHATRERAAGEVREHVGRVSEATSAMLARLESMEAELAGLLEAVRGGAGRLDAGLRELGTELDHAGQVARPQPRAEFHPDAPAEVYVPGEFSPAPGSDPDWGATHENGAESGGAGPSPDPAPSSGWETPESPLGEPAPEPAVGSGESPWAHAEPEPAPGPEAWPPAAEASPPVSEPAPVQPESEAFPDAPSAPPGEAAPAPYGEASSGSSDSSGEYGAGAVTPPEGFGAGGSDDDSEGARLIALNMALNGTPREETARYLAENFQLHDRNRLLDEVYASVEG